MKRHSLLVITLVAVLGALVLSACGTAAASTPDPFLTEDFVDDSTIIADGRLVPQSYASVAFQTGGQITEVLVEEGDVVKKGQVLARLDDHDQQQLVARAELTVQQSEVNVAAAQHNLEILVSWAPNKSQLSGAQADLANAEAAVKAAQAAYDHVATEPAASASPQSLALEQATNNYNKAKANLDFLASSRPDVIAAGNALEAAKLTLSQSQLDLDNAKTALDRMSLRAPLSGVVSGINMRSGEQAAAGQVVATVADFKIWLVLTDNLTELEVTRVAVGQPVTITFDALPDKTFHGEVESIASMFEEKRGDITYTVSITLSDPDPELRWGMTASVEFLPE